MKPLHLPPGSTGAAIRARPVQPQLNVWVHRPKRGVWCALHRATGGRNIYLCLDWSPGNEPIAWHRGEGETCVWDVNQLGSQLNGDGWTTLGYWTSCTVPRLTHDIPRATGGWHVTHAIEVQR